ncbi:MAG: ATP-binding protein [Armatimonadota bacterium]|nr:ATP-binding protein [Armatimonadota bacterium]
MIAIEMTSRRLHPEPVFLTRIRLRARRRALWLRLLWAEGMAEAEQYMAISHNEVDRVLTDPEALAEAESAFYETDAEARQLGEYIRDVDLRVEQMEPLNRLREAFALSEPERDMLTLTAAVEIDPRLRRVYGYLDDDTAARDATPWIAACLFEWPAGTIIGSDSALIRWRLAYPLEGMGNRCSVYVPWVADPHVASYLARGDNLDSALGTAARRLSARAPEAGLRLYPAELSALKEFILAFKRDGSGAPVEIELIGAKGSGRKTLAAEVCAEIGMDMLIVDAGELLGSNLELPPAIDKAIHAARAARLSQIALYWDSAETVDCKILEAAQGRAPLSFFGSASPVQLPRNGSARMSLHLPRLSQSARENLWRHLSDHPIPGPVADWPLVPGQIVSAAMVVPAGPEAVVEACRQGMGQDSEKFVRSLPCPYTWDDIVLPESVEAHIRELETQVRLRWSVYEEWGFEKLCPVGRGITALFAGPSGTGKTMAAQVLARSLGMDLYRIDLATVMSKYIGETEKNLKQIFDSCDRANALLFFDEADALFGRRTQVSDAHDRYANIEIDYLLQRMEQFDGIAILATNRKGDLDTAFVRRIRFIVEFGQPGPSERLAIWRLALLERSPNGEELLENIKWEQLANKLNMTGADIKSAALNAAFLARKEGARIGMKHVVHSARREMEKHGIVVRPGDMEGLCDD